MVLAFEHNYSSCLPFVSVDLYQGQLHRLCRARVLPARELTGLPLLQSDRLDPMRVCTSGVSSVGVQEW
jgi:hypothetical protein